MEVHVVVTYDRRLGRLARCCGLQWTHAALRYVREPSAGAWVIESTACGVREISWKNLIAGAEEHQIFRVKGGLPGVTIREIIAYAWGNVGKPYHYGGLFKIAWELVKRRLVAAPFTYPAHVCSSLVYDCFHYGGIDLIPGHEGVLVTPDDLAKSPLLEEVEVGGGGE